MVIAPSSPEIQIYSPPVVPQFGYPIYQPFPQLQPQQQQQQQAQLQPHPFSYPSPFKPQFSSLYPSPYPSPIPFYYHVSYPPPPGAVVGSFDFGAKEKEKLEKEKLEKEKKEKERLENERLEKEKNKVKNNDGILPKTPTLVIATGSFDGEKYDHLDIKKDEFLVVTNWNCGEKGWVYGHRKNNEREKGIFPEVFIKIYKSENGEIKGNI